MKKLLAKLIQEGKTRDEIREALLQASTMSMGDKYSTARDEVYATLRNIEGMQYSYIVAIYDDEKKVVVENYNDGDCSCCYVELDYVRAEDGVITLSNPTEVQRMTVYRPVEAVLQGSDQGPNNRLVQSMSVRCKITQKASAENGGVMEIQGIATKGNILNTKNQVYPTSLWQSALDGYLKQSAQNRSLLGESDHPDRRSLANSCIVWKDLWMQGNDMHFKADILPTEPDGKNLQILVQNGVPIEVSSYGYGTMKQGTFEGKTAYIVQDDFFCESFDAVLAGASTGSKVTSHKMIQGKGNTMNKEQLLALLVQAQASGNTSEVTRLVQEIQKIDAEFKLEQSTVQPITTPAAAPNTAMPQFDQLVQSVAALTNQINAMNTPNPEMAQLILQNARREATEAAPESLRSKLSERLVQCTSVEAVRDTAKSFVELAQEFGLGTPNIAPGIGMLRQEKQEASAPKTIDEAIERLVQGSGLKDTNDDTPGNMARNLRILLQNSAKAPEGQKAMRMYMLGVSGRAQRMIQSGEMTSTDFVDGNPQLFPIIARVFPRLFAPVIASVQPMRLPDGKIFYLDHKREDGSDVRTPSKDYFNRTAERQTVAKMKLSLTSSNISVDNKAVGANWPVEMAQDLMAYHGIDAELEMMGAIADEVAREWNYTMLTEMYAGATGGDVTFGKKAPEGWSQKDWDAYLVTYLLHTSNQVFKKRYQDATFCLCGTDMALALSKMGAKGGFIPSGTEGEIAAGVNIYGAVNGTLKVYKCAYMDLIAPGAMIIGRKGQTWSDTGYVWAPYTTVVTDKFTDPSTLQTTRSLMERAAHQVVIGDNFAKLTISNATGVEL